MVRTRSRSRIGISSSLIYPLGHVAEVLTDSGYEVSEADIKKAVRDGELETIIHKGEKKIHGKALVAYCRRLDAEREAARKKEAAERNRKRDAELERRERSEDARLKKMTSLAEHGRLREQAIDRLVYDTQKKTTGKIKN